MTKVKERRRRRRKGWAIVVTPIPPERYPEHREDPDHSFASMDSGRRIEEIDQMCAKLWLRVNTATETPTAEKEMLACAA